MIRNMIYIEKDMISVVRLKGDKIEFVKQDGEIDFPVTTDFWDWWKRAVSYIDNDMVDICIVYDKDYDILQHNILKNNIVNFENSTWSIEQIKEYFWNIKPTYFNISITGINKQEYIISKKDEMNCRKFFTNIYIEEKIELEKKIEENIDTLESKDTINESEYSDFARFFRELIRRERG